MEPFILHPYAWHNDNVILRYLGRRAMKNPRIFLLPALFFPIAAHATPAQGWTKSMTISPFLPTDSGVTIVVEDGGDAANNPTSCTPPNWLRISPNDVNYALISSTLLTALPKEKVSNFGSANATAMALRILLPPGLKNNFV